MKKKLLLFTIVFFICISILLAHTFSNKQLNYDSMFKKNILIVQNLKYQSTFTYETPSGIGGEFYSDISLNDIEITLEGVSSDLYNVEIVEESSLKVGCYEEDLESFNEEEYLKEFPLQFSEESQEPNFEITKSVDQFNTYINECEKTKLENIKKYTYGVTFNDISVLDDIPLSVLKFKTPYDQYKLKIDQVKFDLEQNELVEFEKFTNYIFEDGAEYTNDYFATQQQFRASQDFKFSEIQSLYEEKLLSFEIIVTSKNGSQKIINDINEPIEIKKGDVVIFNRYSLIDSSEYNLIQQQYKLITNNGDINIYGDIKSITYESGQYLLSTIDDDYDFEFERKVSLLSNNELNGGQYPFEEEILD